MWGVITAERFTEFLKVITILLPCFILVIVVIKRIYGAVNNNYNIETKPLKAYKWLTKKTVLPLKNLILDYIEFVRQNRWIWITWLIIWIFHLNLATIVVEFFCLLLLLRYFLSARYDLSAVRKTRGRFTGAVYTRSVVGFAHNWHSFARPLAPKDCQKQIKTLRST